MKKPRQLPDTKQCVRCLGFSPPDRFSPDLRQALGLSSHCKRCRAEEVLLKQRGIVFEDWARLFERQNGGCGACKAPISTGGRATHLDHDHSTGAIRGLLCSQCNVTLGNVKDSPDTLRRLANYLTTNGVN